MINQILQFQYELLWIDRKCTLHFGMSVYRNKTTTYTLLKLSQFTRFTVQGWGEMKGVCVVRYRYIVD